MTSQYSHKQFIRRVPNDLIADYFKSKNINVEIDFEKLKETNVDVIFQTFSDFPEEQQATIEADFQDINNKTGHP